LGFFLYAILGEWAELCTARGDQPRAHRYQAHRVALRAALESAAWDGEWYRRGWYDDGTPLGTAAADECRIDALVQAWAVISGAAAPERAARAMDSADRHLVSERDGIVRLLTPAFDRTANDPGYIKGYLPGVRENGGQYTHAALWVARAFAELGRADRAARVLEMLSPVSHAADPESAARYQVEPYVVAADVYGEPPHVGRGGWTWYTGSAGWMQRVVVETLLGLSVENGDTLVVIPRAPAEWTRYRIQYRPPGETTCYRIEVQTPAGDGERLTGAALDGRPVQFVDTQVRVPLVRDGAVHRLVVERGPSGQRRSSTSS
jgi:cyclic beta-1,2-glucan synthetase